MRKLGISILAGLAVLGVSTAALAGILPRAEDQFRVLVDARTPQSEITRDLGMLDVIAGKVRDDYVDAIDPSQMEDAAIQGMLKIDSRRGATQANKLFEAAAGGLLSSLDPHSSYLSPAQYKELQVASAGKFGGVGISVTMENGRLKVVTPLDGTPASRAGIQAGDFITHINGAAIDGWSLAQAVNTMRGDPGTHVRVTIDRGGRILQVPLVREIITIQSVRWRREGDLGYIRVSSFSQDAPSGVKAALQGLWAQPSGPPVGIVLDLRSNPGGLLEAAVKVADLFIDAGNISILRGRSGDQNVLKATPGDLSHGASLAVLIDGGTASAAELVTTALRSLRRAVVVGTRSFGKGSVQTIWTLDNGGAFKLTTARYYSDLGTTFDGAGVDPDVVAEKGPDKNVDNVLERAVATVSRYGPAAMAGGAARQPGGAGVKFPRHSKIAGFKQNPPRPDDIAVIIGNADYGRLGIDLPDVVPAYADAEGVKRYVKQTLGVREGNIIDLRDATGAQMSRVFGTDSNPRGQLFDWVRPGRSRVFVYYAGHGAPGGDGGAYLVPADADGSRIQLNGYPLRTLYRNLGQLRAKSVTVVLEACFSGISQGGALVARSSGVYVQARAPQVPPNITVISAGTAEQVASWEEDSSQSLFTEYFLKGMAGAADGKPYGDGDGTVSPAELNAYLKDTLTYYARRYYGRDQTAQIVVGKNR